jgi:hypothetical protein
MVSQIPLAKKVIARGFKEFLFMVAKGLKFWYYFIHS